MSFDLGPTGELNALVRAIGLVGSDGSIDATWFENPVSRLQHMLTTQAQREALENFLDLVVPPQAEPGRPVGEKWHPVLGPQPNGNLFFTVRDTGSGIALGVAGELHSTTSPVPARLRVQADVLTAGSALEVVVGTAAHPLVAEVRIETGWTVGAGHPVGLGAIAASFNIVAEPPSVDLKLVLEQLQVAGEPAGDKVLDVANLGHDVPQVLVALIKAALAEAGATPEVTMLSDHLLELLGLSGTGSIPAFPIAELSNGPAALQQWIATLSGSDGTPASAAEWLGHLGGLLGQTTPATGTGTADDPWQVALFALPGGGSLNATLALVPGHLRVGLALGIDASLGAGEPRVGLQAEAVITEIPLSGTAHARVLPTLRALGRVTGDPGSLVSDPSVQIDHAQFGLSWDGTTLRPLLELIAVQFGGTTYPKLDLTNVQSVEAAAASAVVSALTSALGSGVGRHLAALIGLVAPEDPANPGTAVPGWAHQLDLGVLVAHPTRAIAGYHLAVLGDGDRWSLMVHELAGLLGVAPSVTGSGTPDAPWVVALPGAGAVPLQLAGWQVPGASGGRRLGLGVRLGVTSGSTSFAWLGELLGFDLGTSGAGAVSLIGKQSVALTMAPAVATTVGAVAVALDSLRAAAEWTPGQPLALTVHAQGFSLTADGQTVAIPDLHLPPVGGFDLTNLSATAAGLGISVSLLEDVVRIVLGLMASIAGAEEQVVAALLGLTRDLPGLAEDLPGLVDPALPGLLLTNPVGALQAWLGRLVTHVSASGHASLIVILRWLAALAEELVDDLAAQLPTDLLDGAGTFESPWRLAWPGAGTTGPQLDVWLEPAGAPSAWVAGLAARAQAATGFDELAEIVDELSWHDDDLASLVEGLSSRGLTERLTGLATYLNSGDGVVPSDSQNPDIFGWANDVSVDAAHHLAPTHPDAIAAILQQIENLKGTSARTVLLIGPSFSDHTVWDALLASPQRQGPTDAGAHFDLRTPGIDPATISLASVTAVADYYTADLADDRSGDVSHLVAQIAHVADRIAELHPGPLTLVTHSYAALAARSFAASHPARVQALITVAAPHVGSPLAFLNDVELGDAVRIAATMRPTMAASPLRDAIDHLTTALEGYLPPAVGGTLAVPDPYPALSFGMAAPFDLGTTAVVTIGAALCDDAFEWLRAALIARINQIEAATSPTPTHLSYGMSMPVAVGAAVAGLPAASARVRHGLGRIALGHGAAAPPRAAQLVRVELDLFNADGWVVGGPAASDADGRLRSLQIGATAQHLASGPTVVIDATLNQGAWHGLTGATRDLSDPVAGSLIGAAFGSVLAANEAADGTISALGSALAAIDLLSTDATGATGLSADGFASLRSDPVGYLGARVPAALAAGWVGFIQADPSKTEYTYTPASSAYSLFVNRPSGWHTGVRTAAADPGSALNIGVDVDVAMSDLHSAVELFVTVGVVGVRWHSDTGAITADAPPFVHDLAIWPAPSVADLAAQLDTALPRLLGSGALTAVVAQFAPGLKVGMLVDLFAAPGDFLEGALGQAGGGFDPGQLAAVIDSLRAVLALPSPGLTLPSGLRLTAGPGAVTGQSRIDIATTAPIAGVLAVDVGVDIDRLRHPTPHGTVTVTVPLSGSWQSVAIAFGISTGGVTLVVTPHGAPAITLLPTFSGLGALQGAAAALLPAALDAAVGTFATPRPAWLQHLLAAATALGLYSAGGFAPNTAAFTALLQAHLPPGADRAGTAAAVVDLLTLVPALSGNLSHTDGLVQCTLTLPAGQGVLVLGAGATAAGATASVEIQNLKPTGAPLEIAALARVDATGVDARLALGADLSALGVAKVPRLIAEVDTADPTRLRVRFAPLSDTGTDGPLVIDLAPAFSVATSADVPKDLIVDWALPLAVEVAVKAADAAMNHPIHAGGPTLKAALVAAGILDATGASVAHPLPGVFEALAKFLLAVSSGLSIPLGELHLALHDESNRAGIAISGKQDLPLGEITMSIVFGAPTTWGAAAAEGLVLKVLDTSGATPKLNIGVELLGVGVAFSKSDGTPLVAEEYLRLGSVLAVLFLDIETTPSLSVSKPGAGMQLGGFGLPLGAALGAGAAGGSNPVASNILSSGGSSSAGGSSPGVNPSADVDVWYWDDPRNRNDPQNSAHLPLRVLVGGRTGLLWIPVHAGFGPIFISEIGLGVSGTDVSIAIDGGVSIAGLSAEVDQLTLGIPYANVKAPTLDLRGLAVGYNNAGLSIAGGLVKYDGPPIEYDGMLLVKVASIGAIVIGSYSVVGSGSDQYTSLAIFGGVFVPIGIPPVVNLTGFALGLGYNRRLIVPEDLNQIPSFMLVEALDKPEALANNPMQALFSFRDEVPPERGALWLAAGVRGTAFEIVNITAVLYVAIDNGVDVGILGVARMALPTDTSAIVSIELALKARFSSAEGLFSVQAQLTDNSWLISHDCELTGGFAFFMWFRKSQFLLTLGGYHPAFKPLPEYPVVPRLGYHWNFLGVVHIKGESYFALTNTCVMAGVRTEATYGPDWLQLWFIGYADILIAWDPFHYEVDAGVAVGARLRIRICFFACATIEISVSVGADLVLIGPPFHGVVKVDLGVCTVTVPFGSDPDAQPPALSWSAFRDKYVKSGDDNSNPVTAQICRGLLPAEPAGAPVAPGTADQPWRLSAEWSFETQTRMPTRGYMFQTNGSNPFGTEDPLGGTYAFDLAPMYVVSNDITTTHRVVIARKLNGSFRDVVPQSADDGSADRQLVVLDELFAVRTLIVQVSEATYHYFPGLKPPAAANTLPALGGLHVDGLTKAVNPSKPVPIGKLVDATNPRPLPFARRLDWIINEILAAGSAWKDLAALADGSSSLELLNAAHGILGAARPEFAALRADSGLPKGGYGPVALSSLAGRRSAPPMISALSEGFTLTAPGIGVPPVEVALAEPGGVQLTEPRLRAVMQRSVLPAGSTTTVTTTAPSMARSVPIVDVRSALLTSWDAPGFALLKRSTDTAVQPTRSARSARSLRSAALGGPVGRSAAEAFQVMAEEVLGKGVTVRAGCTHVWELPGGSGWQLDLAGTSAVRVTELSTAGTALFDREYAGAPGQVAVAAGCAMVAVTALGASEIVGDGIGGPGAVTSASASGSEAVLGWELDGEGIQVGPTTVLTRGSVLSLSARVGSVVRGHVEAIGVIPLARAVSEQQVARTEFPTDVTVVGVLVDRADAALVTADTVVVHSEGATLAERPVEVAAGNRTLFLYDLVSVDQAATEALAISVGLVDGLTLSGVVAMRGTASAWAQSLDGTTLHQLVPSEHLTQDGAVTVRLTQGVTRG